MGPTSGFGNQLKDLGQVTYFLWTLGFHVYIKKMVGIAYGKEKDSKLWMPLLLFGGDCEEEFIWSIFFSTSDALDSLETLFLKVYSVDAWDQDYQFPFKKM